MNNRTLFFEASQSITKRLGELFDFFWPAMAGLWNLRWQVNGYSSSTNKREAKDLYAKFVEGSGVTSANLKVACIESSWEEQREQFARFLLVELCALYEGWLEDVVPRVVTSNIRRIQDNLQFPSGASSGLSFAISAVNATPSTLLKTEFFPALIANKKNSWINREELLHAYRYFKEIRNAVIHRGGVASQSNVDARSRLVGIPIANLGFKKAPLIPPMTVRSPIKLELSDIVGLSNIIHRLIVTFDAALAVSSRAEDELWIRIYESYVRAKAKGKLDILSPNVTKRQRQITSLLVSARLPQPVNTSLLLTGFSAKGIG